MNEINIYKGNTVYLQIIPTLNGEEYILTETDKVYVTVRNSCGEKVLEKTLTLADYSEEVLLLKLNADDTAELPPQTYDFDCAITIDGEFFTFVIPSKLVLHKTITQYSEIIEGDNNG